MLTDGTIVRLRRKKCRCQEEKSGQPLGGTFSETWRLYYERLLYYERIVPAAYKVQRAKRVTVTNLYSELS